MVGISTYFFRGGLRAAVTSEEKVADLVERTGAHSYGTHLMASVGHYRALLGEAEIAAARFAQSLRTARSTKDQLGVLCALTLRGHAELLSGGIAAAVETLSEAHAVIGATGTKFWLNGVTIPALALARLQRWRANGANHRAELRAIGKIAAEGLAFTRSRRQFRCYALTAAAAHAAAAGNARRARSLFERAEECGQSQRNAWGLAEVHLELGRALAAEGRQAQAIQLLDQAAIELEAMGMAPAAALARETARAAR